MFVKFEKEVDVKKEEEVVADDGSSLVPKSMVEEEENLLKARAKEDEEQLQGPASLNESQFDKLDELLTQTKLYSEFLLEKMDDITLVFPFLISLIVLTFFLFFLNVSLMVLIV